MCSRPTTSCSLVASPRPEPGRLRLLLLGVGGVGRAFIEVLDASAPTLGARFGLHVQLVAARRAGLEATPLPGLEPDRWPWRPARPLDELLADVRPDAVVQAVPSDPGGASEVLRDAMATLRSGAHLVTATKSHLVHHWAALESAALAAGRAVRVSGAAGAALPAADLARRGTRALGCRAIRGSLNGTSNYVLGAMAVGRIFGEAVAEARRRGIAEPDASGDLSGEDAAAKLVILANLAWGTAWTIADVAREPVDASLAARALGAASAGRALRAVAWAGGAQGPLAVRIEEVEAGDPLHVLPGAEKAVIFDCGEAGTIAVSGGRSSPRGAGAALLKDIVNLATGDASPGIA